MVLLMVIATAAAKAGAAKLGVMTIEEGKKRLFPGDFEKAIEAGILAARKADDALPGSQHLLIKCDDKDTREFLTGVMTDAAVLGELRKPLENHGTPDQSIVVEAFSRVALSLSIELDTKNRLPGWVGEFLRVYFEKTKAAIAFSVARDRYLAALVNSCDDVKFVGIDAAVKEKDRSAKLIDIFVVPNVLEEQDSQSDRKLLEQEMPVHLDDEQAELWLEQRKRWGFDRLANGVTVHELLTPSRRKVVLLGEPGSGKTTLMRYLAIKVARGESDDFGLMADEPWLPVLVYLRDWAKNPERSLIAQLEDFAKNTLEVELPEGFFQHWLAGRSLVLLDGLDEVIDDATRSRLVDKLECALEEKAHNAVILTSRPWGYRRASFRTESFPHFELAQFDDDQIESFIQKWYESRNGDPTDAKEMIDNLQESLEMSDRVKQLVRNPLLLTIVVLIHRYQDVLPKRRHELYDKAVSTLLKSWDRTSKGLREQQKDFFKTLDIDDDLRRIMSLLAKWVHEQYETKNTEGGTLVREKNLLEQLSLIIQDEVVDIKPHKADEEAKRFVEFIRDRTGLINEYGTKSYGFVHKTFQEYLTAEAIQREGRYEFSTILNSIKIHLHQPHWQEVILLLVAQQEGKGAAQAIDCILRKGSEYEKYLHRDLLCAAQCLTEDPARLKKADPALVSEILDRLIALAITSSPSVGGHVKNGAGNFLKRLRGTAFQAEALEKLKAQGERSDLVNFLRYRAYLGEKEEAINELLLLLLLKDSSVYVLWNAVNALVSIGKNDSRVVDELLLLLKAPKSDAYGIFAHALGQIGKINSKVVDRLLLLLKDSESDVRAGAASSLGKIGNSDSRVVDELLLLLKDSESDVRGSAANALGNIGNSDFRVVDELLLLLKDPESDVRGSAANALGNIGNSDSRVVDELLLLLKNSESNVRGSAANVLGNIGNGDSRVVDELLLLLKDPESNVRGRVVPLSKG
jgi:hypothetical protein